MHSAPLGRGRKHLILVLCVALWLMINISLTGSGGALSSPLEMSSVMSPDMAQGPNGLILVAGPRSISILSSDYLYLLFSPLKIKCK